VADGTNRFHNPLDSSVASIRSPVAPFPGPTGHLQLDVALRSPVAPFPGPTGHPQLGVALRSPVAPFPGPIGHLQLGVALRSPVAPFPGPIGHLQLGVSLLVLAQNSHGSVSAFLAAELTDSQFDCLLLVDELSVLLPSLANATLQNGQVHSCLNGEGKLDRNKQYFKYTKKNSMV
jgi:hypothetical protein